MAHPMAFFRQHQRRLLAVFGVALILVFTVGSIVSQYLEMARASGANKVVVNLGSGDLRESDLQQLRNSRQLLQRFMQVVNVTAASKGATPKRFLGVPDRDDENSLVQTAILARQASDMGIQVSDDSIIRFLERYTDGTMQPGEFAAVLQNITQGRVSQAQFFEAMRREMLAIRFTDLFQRGITPATPSAIFDYWERLNRRLSFEAVPFEAADYLARVGEPESKEVEQLFEEGKERYPRPDSPDPGFRRLKKVAFQYIKGDLETFMADAKAQVTAAQIQEYYDSHKEQFRRVALPGSPLGGDTGSPLGGTAPDASSNLPGSTPAATPPSTPADPTSEAAPEAGAEPPTQPLQDDPSDGGPKINQAPEGEAPPAETPPVEDAPVDAPAVEEPAAPAGEDAPAAESETPAATTDAPQATEPAAETTEGEAPATEEKPADGTETTPDDVLDDLPDAPGGNAPAADSTYRSLEEVAEDIRTLLATPIARTQLEAALSTVRGEMRSYYSKYIGWEVSPSSKDKPQPTPPDLRVLTEKHKLTLGEVPLVNVFQLQETDPITGKPVYEISQAFDMNFIPFAQYAFANDLRKFEVRSIRGYLLDTEFLFWKTDDQPERVPELSEVRDEVVRALKMRKAIELAKEDAKRAADELAKSGQRPSDAYRNDPNRRVIKADSVAWMTSSNLPEMPPSPTRIPGVTYAGPDFMRAVFRLDANQAGMAVDNPQDTAYAVFVTKVDTSMDQLRTQFASVGPTNDTVNMSMDEGRDALNRWFRQREKELELRWNRESLPDSRTR
jgi:hypothetical protein